MTTADALDRRAARLALTGEPEDTPFGLNRQTVAVLRRKQPYPAVSILLSVGTSRPEMEARLARMVQTASVRLLGEFARPEVQNVLDALNALATTAHIRKGDQGLAVFASASEFTALSLPFSVRDRVAVDDTFATRDLVHTLLRSPTYQVLVLGGETIRMFAGVGFELKEFHAGGFPVVVPQAETDDKSRDGIDRSDIRDAEMRRQIQMLDGALDAVMPDHDPLLVVGASRRLSMFRKHSKHRGRVSSTLIGVLERKSAVELAGSIRPMVGEIIERRQRQSMTELDEAISRGRHVFGIDDIWRMAGEGRCELLIVEENFVYPARLDRPTNTLTPAADIDHPEVIDDVADDIIEIVLAKGGRVTIVADGTFASRDASSSFSGRIAATLRH